MIHYQLLVKALLSLKQIMANHTFYFQPLSYMHGHARSLLHISHYTLIYPRLYSLPSVCTDMIVFHTDLKDSDLIRGNQNPGGEQMNGREIIHQNSTLKCY